MDVKTVLEEREMPTHWYNIQADLPRPLDPPHQLRNQTARRPG